MCPLNYNSDICSRLIYKHDITKLNILYNNTNSLNTNIKEQCEDIYRSLCDGLSLQDLLKQCIAYIYIVCIYEGTPIHIYLVTVNFAYVCHDIFLWLNTRYFKCWIPQGYTSCFRKKI